MPPWHFCPPAVLSTRSLTGRRHSGNRHAPRTRGRNSTRAPVSPSIQVQRRPRISSASSGVRRCQDDNRAGIPSGAPPDGNSAGIRHDRCDEHHGRIHLRRGSTNPRRPRAGRPFAPPAPEQSTPPPRSDPKLLSSIVSWHRRLGRAALLVGKSLRCGKPCPGRNIQATPSHRIENIINDQFVANFCLAANGIATGNVTIRLVPKTGLRARRLCRDAALSLFSIAASQHIRFDDQSESRNAWTPSTSPD